MTRVVTDGAADLPEELRRSAGITVIRGPVQVDGERWHGEPGRFWAEIAGGRRAPTTDAPSVEQLTEAYAGDEPVLAVHVSGELSRTLARARDAAARCGAPVQVIDSRSLSVGTGLVALSAAEAIRAGTSGDRLRAMTEGWIDQLHVHALIDDVQFLVRGGRAGLVAAKVGRHANRHLVAVRGHVIPLRQVRHRSEAFREMLDHLREHLVGGVTHWAVGHGNAADVDEVVQRLTGTFGCEASYVTLLGAPVGSHLGPRSLVVGFFSDS